YEVALAERGREVGGRVTKESRLPGLSTWARVRDHRTQALEKLPSVVLYRESELDAESTIGLGFSHVVIATGAVWRRDGVGPTILAPIEIDDNVHVLTPDDIFNGADVTEPILVYDDDHYYLGSSICEMLRGRNKEVIFVTPLNEVAAWTYF